jgi:hypothetical protein
MIAHACGVWCLSTALRDEGDQHRQALMSVCVERSKRRLVGSETQPMCGGFKVLGTITSRRGVTNYRQKCEELHRRGCRGRMAEKQRRAKYLKSLFYKPLKLTDSLFWR